MVRFIAQYWLYIFLAHFVILSLLVSAICYTRKKFVIIYYYTHMIYFRYCISIIYIYFILRFPVITRKSIQN